MCVSFVIDLIFDSSKSIFCSMIVQYQGQTLTQGGNFPKGLSNVDYLTLAPITVKRGQVSERKTISAQQMILL